MLPTVLKLTLVLIALLLASCGRSAAPPELVTGLPGLSNLPLAGTQRSVSATSFELLPSLPVLTSVAGANATGNQLSLSPAADQLSWAVYALQGFPTDGTIVPQSVTIARSAPCWLAFSDFGSGRWEFARSDAPGIFTPTGTDLVSDSGAFYVAVLGIVAWNNPTGAVNVSSLVVQSSGDLPAPAPNITMLSVTGQLAANVPSTFSAAGSDPGTGAVYDTLSWDWNDGSPVDVTTDPLTEISHVWTTTGPHSVTLTIVNDLGRSNSITLQVTLAAPFREMLVVYNSEIPESLDLCNYYCGSAHGRSIDVDYILGLPMGTDANADFSRSTYESQLRNPVKFHLDASGYKDSIKYILLIKGVPHRISDGSGRSAADSELCMLYSDLGPSNGGYPYVDWLISDPKGFVEYNNINGAGFYLATEDFVPNTFEACYDPTYDNPDSGDETPYTLNYLVGRLSAYTYDEAKLMVDRSLASDKSGTGWAILDSRPAQYGWELDTMVDPVWPWTDDSKDSGYELLDDAGFNVFADVTFDLITKLSPSLPAGAGDAVLAYCSWGVHSGHNSEYILNDLQFTYLPGACFMSYESFNGVNFNGDNVAGGRSGQGQICDFIRMGGSCAIGNCWEPYTIGVGDERWVYDRYINQGDRWIEAAYKGLRLLSWMEVVIGDPLCTVK